MNDNHLPSNPVKQGIPYEFYDDIFEKYNSGLTLQQIHNQYYPQFTTDQINYICREKGITRKNGRQVVLYHDYFSNIDTEEKAYFLGLFAADGHLYWDKQKGESYNISLALMKQDKYIVEKFAKAIGTDKEVKEYTNTTGFQRKDGQPHIECRIVVSSKQMYNDLNKWGVMEHKSALIKSLPNLNDDMMRHYIRGYFDGNGSAFVTKQKGYMKLKMAIYSTHDFCTNIKQYLEQRLNLNVHKVYDHKTENCSFISYYTEGDLKRLYHYMYEEATCYLTRKKEIIENYLQT